MPISSFPSLYLALRLDINRYQVFPSKGTARRGDSQLHWGLSRDLGIQFNIHFRSFLVLLKLLFDLSPPFPLAEIHFTAKYICFAGHK
jgi:hypothetical protein